MLRVTCPFVWLVALALFSGVMGQGAQAENRGCEEGARLRSFCFTSGRDDSLRESKL